MLETALQYFKDEIRPKAYEIDHDPKAMAIALEGLKERGLLALRRSDEFGGPAFSENDFRQFQEQVARHSGALAFLQTQNQTAVSLISKHAGDALKQTYLPHMHGPKTVGLGFSQLRRPDNDCYATEVDGGFLIKGKVPWLTGKGYFDEYIIGAAMQNGQSLFGIIPLKTVKGQTLSKPMKLAAMEAAQTVEAHLDGYFLPHNKVAFTKDKDWLKTNDNFNITLQGHFAIGCSLAGVDIIRDVAIRREPAFLTRIACDLEKEINECREALIDSQRDINESTTEKRLEQRAWAITLMMRCAQAAVTCSGGGANKTSNPANRVLREAIVFSVSAQTSVIMKATMETLAVPNPLAIKS